MRVRAVLTFVVVLGVYAAPAVAAPGDLDPGFGSGGKKIEFFSRLPCAHAEVRALAPDPDSGKIYAAGHSGSGPGHDLAIARFNSDGSLDPGFGKVVTSFYTPPPVARAAGPCGDPGYDMKNSQAEAVIVSVDKPVVAGWVTGSNGGFALLRYLPDGTLDPSFSGDGKVVTPFGSDIAEAHALVELPDGRLVAAGSRRNSDAASLALARYWADGSLDSSFGTGGTTETPLGRRHGGATAIVRQPDGKLVVAGSTSDGFGWPHANANVVLARYDADGSPDPTFGSNGLAVTPVQHRAEDLVLQPDGKLVIAGAAEMRYLLARFNEDGSLDSTFGSGGVSTESPPGHAPRATALTQLTDGRFAVTGVTGAPPDCGVRVGHFAVSRFDTNGNPDPAFGTSGHVITGFGNGSGANAVLALPSGRLLTAGWAVGSADPGAFPGQSPASGFALAQYLLGSEAGVASSVDQCPAPPSHPEGSTNAARKSTPGLPRTRASIRCRGRRCVARFRGRVPLGAASAALTCWGGEVRLRLLARGRRVLNSGARTNNACRYRAVRRFRLPRRARRVRRLVVHTRFLGTEALHPRSSTLRRVRVARR